MKVVATASILVTVALLLGGATFELWAQRPFEISADGSFVFGADNGSTITIGPMPATLAGREPILLISALDVVRGSYPATLREAGISGTVMVGLYVHWGGQVHQTRIDQTSGIAGFDQAALLVASAMGFTQVPAGSPLTFAWISVPIRFQIG
jgi:TonB family protein